MKNCIMLLFVVCLLVGLCACGEINTSTTEPEGTDLTQQTTGLSVESANIRAGYAAVKITPEESVPLAGYGNTSTRMSNNVLSDLYATCLALTDEADNTVLLIAMDLICAGSNIVSVARPLISAATNVPEDHIMITASHTHSGPDTNNGMDAIERYLEKLNKEWLVQVAQEAMADRLPATLSVGSAETENLNFVRHYTYVDADGQKHYFGDNFGTAVKDETTAHATDADPTMHLVQFTREGGKNIVLANWRAHPGLTGGSKKYDISADYVGAFRKNLEKMYKCHVIYFQGAAGNINASSRLSNELRTTSYIQHGELLATDALKCLRKEMIPVEADVIQIRQTRLEADLVEVSDTLLQAAKQVQSVWTATGDYQQAVAVGGDSGIRSPYQANVLVAVGQLTQKTMELELNAVTIGDAIALVTAPNELFDTNSMWLEEQSPYTMTLTLGYANGNHGYIPSKLGFDYSCYESDVCKFKVGTGETIQDTFLQMLNTMIQ